MSGKRVKRRQNVRGGGEKERNRWNNRSSIVRGESENGVNK